MADTGGLLSGGLAAGGPVPARGISLRSLDGAGVRDTSLRNRAADWPVLEFAGPIWRVPIPVRGGILLHIPGRSVPAPADGDEHVGAEREADGDREPVSVGRRREDMGEY